MNRRFQHAPSREPRAFRRRPSRWLLLLSLLLLPVALVSCRAQEEGALRQSAARLERGELEGALAALEPLLHRPLLSGGTRRQAAELYLRLGEDSRARDLLRGQRFDAKSADDTRLRDRIDRCRRASELLEQASHTVEPAERVRLVAEARQAVPESPRVLQRLVQEELLAMTRSPAPEASQAFEEGYRELRRKAPGLADALKRKVGAAVARDSE
jgi:hypothetical protein